MSRRNVYGEEYVLGKAIVGKGGKAGVTLGEFLPFLIVELWILQDQRRKDG